MTSAINESDVDRLTGLMEKREWPQVISDPQPIETAVQAYHEGRINAFQLATVVIFGDTFKAEKITPETIPLFINDKINPVARRYIAQSVQSVRRTNPKLPSSYLFSHLPNEKLDEFFEKMKKQPLSEQNFLLMHTRSPYPNLQLVLSKLGLNGFSICNSFDKVMEVVPSFSMMQTLLDVKYGDKAPRLNPDRVSIPLNVSQEPLPRNVLARLHLAYALLLASTPANESPETAFREILKSIPTHPKLKEEVAHALKQMPRDPSLDPFLQLVSKILNEPQSKL